MNFRFLKTAALLPLVLSVTMAACNDLTDSSRSITGPSERSDAVVITKGKKGFKIATETDPQVTSMTVELDRRGGSLNIGAHTLTVPEGAVRGPTTFTMTRASAEVKFSLTATSKRGKKLNDVGEKGFRRPLTLSVSYAGLTELEGNLEDLRIVWVKDNGDEVELATQVDESNQVVEAKLRHFSDYALAWPSRR